jgi:signal transduction histidine kinase/GAF domain-containing protein
MDLARGWSLAGVTSMEILSEASKIISSPLGSLVYHLLLLLAVEAALAMAWGEWHRAQREQAKRLFFAVGGLILVRVPYLVGALLAPDWLPPLERFVDTASIALLGWAFMPLPKRGAHTWDLVFGANLLATVIVCVVFSILWSNDPQASYNSSWQAGVWSLWQMGLTLLASMALMRRQNEGWGTFFAAIVALFVGALLQLIYTLTVPDVPIWERMGNLVAYPLIAIAVYQNIIAGLRVHSRQLQDISQASLDQIKSLLFLFEASQQMSASLDLSSVLDNAVQGIARALGADQCSIAFPVEGDPSQMRLVAIFNPARQGRGEGVAFPFEYQLTVQQAMRRKRYVIAEESDNVQLKVLFALMGSSEVGPLLVQPLVAEGEAIGAIIVGNSRSRRPFTPNEAKLCQSMAEQLVGAIQNARRYQAAQNSIRELNQAAAEDRRLLEQTKAQIRELGDRLTSTRAEMEDLVRREETAREARNALEIRLVSSRAETESLSERLAVLESDLKQAHANAEAQARWHREDLVRQQVEWEETIQSVDLIQGVLQGMTAGILVASVEGVIQETNVAAEILLDRDHEELQGLELEAISNDERWQQAVASAGGGEAVRLTMQIGANTLMCDVAPLPDLETSQGPLRGVIAILQDISAEIEERRTHLETIASMAEELRTPMTTILSYADLILSEAMGLVGETQRKFLLRIKASTERMIQMAGDLTRIAGGEERWTSPQRQTVDLNRLIEAAVANSSVNLEDKILSLDLDLPEDLPAIQADPDYLRRVVSNLLSNACLASSAGGRIHVQTMCSNSQFSDREHFELNGDGYVIVAVKDSGGGLTDEALSRVFDRGRPSQTPSGLGESGAGLALVKTLVEAQGGRLWVESEKGVGTTFCFVLPVNARQKHSAVGQNHGNGS